jgi:hypothetical protein
MGKLKSTALKAMSKAKSRPRNVETDALVDVGVMSVFPSEQSWRTCPSEARLLVILAFRQKGQEQAEGRSRQHIATRRREEEAIEKGKLKREN